MHVKKFAFIIGLFMLIVGAVSFIPSLSEYPSWLPLLKNDTSYGLFMGIPMNVFNKAALIVFGALGIYCATVPDKNLPYSIAYSRLLFAVMGTLAILGLIPQTNTLGGYMPLFGYDVLLHAAYSLLGAYFGFALTAKVPPIPERNESRQPTRTPAESYKHV